MTKSKLNDAIQAVDWNANVSEFAADVGTVQRFERCSQRIAIGSRQFETADRGNPALSFVREMQVAGHSVPALAALALYKPSAAAMRTVCETALYYTFFRTHHAEMASRSGLLRALAEALPHQRSHQLPHAGPQPVDLVDRVERCGC